MSLVARIREILFDPKTEPAVCISDPAMRAAAPLDATRPVILADVRRLPSRRASQEAKDSLARPST